MSFKLHIAPAGASIDVEPGQTVLDAALRQGIALPYACGHGLCGTCKVQVCEGEVDPGPSSSFALMDVERSEGKVLACCATLKSDATIEADVDEDPDARRYPVLDITGDVTRIVDVTPTIKSVFVATSRRLLFQAGQYIHLEIPGLDASRAFSIANSPTQAERTGEIELNVRVVPGGPGTAYVHDVLRVGERLRFSGPYGRFFVRESDRRPMIFMAGGSGLSAPRSMIIDLLERGCELPVILLYGQRTHRELYGHDELSTLADRYSNFMYVPSLSEEPQGSNWTGERGLVHEVAQKYLSSGFADMQAYVCGPPPMVDACIGVLMRGRMFERYIHTERFVTAATPAASRSPLFKRF